jgi:hypothetical protein
MSARKACLTAAALENSLGAQRGTEAIYIKGPLENYLGGMYHFVRFPIQI